MHYEILQTGVFSTPMKTIGYD